MDFIQRFIDIILKGSGSGMRTVRFLDYFGYLLDSINEIEMTKLRDSYSEVVAKITEVHDSIQFDNRHEKLNQLKSEERILANRINTESFGREHFFREIGLQYFFSSRSKDQQNEE